MKWYRLTLASAVSKAYPKLFWQIREEVKKQFKEHLDYLEEGWKQKWLPKNIRSVRRSEYITGYALTEFRKRHPDLVKKVMEVW